MVSGTELVEQLQTFASQLDTLKQQWTTDNRGTVEDLPQLVVAMDRLKRNMQTLSAKIEEQGEQRQAFIEGVDGQIAQARQTCAQVEQVTGFKVSCILGVVSFW
jgi:hypothetical protein